MHTYTCYTISYYISAKVGFDAPERPAGAGQTSLGTGGRRRCLISTQYGAHVPRLACHGC